MNVTIIFTNGIHEYIKNIYSVQKDRDNNIGIFELNVPFPTLWIPEEEIKSIVLTDFYETPMQVLDI